MDNLTTLTATVMENKRLIGELQNQVKALENKDVVIPILIMSYATFLCWMVS